MMNSSRNDMESWYKMRVQEIETAAARQNMEHGYQVEEVKRLRQQIGDLRGKLGDLDGRVGWCRSKHAILCLNDGCFRSKS